jgi:ATP-dependent Lon protease
MTDKFNDNKVLTTEEIAERALLMANPEYKGMPPAIVRYALQLEKFAEADQDAGAEPFSYQNQAITPWAFGQCVTPAVLAVAQARHAQATQMIHGQINDTRTWGIKFTVPNEGEGHEDYLLFPLQFTLPEQMPPAEQIEQAVEFVYKLYLCAPLYRKEIFLIYRDALNLIDPQLATELEEQLRAAQNVAEGKDDPEFNIQEQEAKKLEDRQKQIAKEKNPRDEQSTNPGEIPVLPEPTILFLNAKKLEAFPELRSYHHDNNSQKTKSMVKRIREAGNDRRQLAVLPDDWEAMLDEFNSTFPNFSELTEMLRKNFALHTLSDRRVYWSPILLLGEPGIGKTEVAHWLAEHFDVPFKLFDMASAQSSSQLAGSEAFWSNSKPGLLFDLLAYEQKANPVCVLDELDKVSGSSYYDPDGPLHTLLERRSARKFTDLSIEVFDIDASHICWLATANEIEPIPLSLRSRLTILEIPTPTREQIPVIARNIYKNLCKDEAWGKEFPETPSDAVIERLLDIPPRAQTICLRNAFGAAALAKRRELLPQDIVVSASFTKRQVGFIAP